MGAPFTEKGSCRWTCHRYGGLASDFCSACTEHAELSDRELRRRVKSGMLALEGSCLKKKQASATGVTTVVEDSGRTSRRTRHVAVKHEATATGKMHAERAPDGMKKRKKRRLSVLRSKQAEAVFKKPGEEGKARRGGGGVGLQCCKGKDIRRLMCHRRLGFVVVVIRKVLNFHSKIHSTDNNKIIHCCWCSLI